jgi:dCMP deaminase
VDSIRLSKKEYYLQMLKLVAARSTCSRRMVGAIITDADGHILSTGYNGVPRDFDHCIDVPCLGANDMAGNTTNCLSVHAEQNALLQCSNLQLARIIYVSCTPCFVCAKMIANTDIDTVICEMDYADTRGRDILIRARILLVISGIEIGDA